jgi:hypothetical protein
MKCYVRDVDEITVVIVAVVAILAIALAYTIGRRSQGGSFAIRGPMGSIEAKTRPERTDPPEVKGKALDAAGTITATNTGGGGVDVQDARAGGDIELAAGDADPKA